MITFIRDSLLRLFYYWKKTVMDRLGRPRQNGYFIVAIRPQYRFSLPPNSDKYWYQGENSRLIPGIHTLDIIQIPIVLRHTVLPCLCPAVSSLGACPTPAR